MYHRHVAEEKIINTFLFHFLWFFPNHYLLVQKVDWPVSMLANYRKVHHSIRKWWLWKRGSMQYTPSMHAYRSICVFSPVQWIQKRHDSIYNVLDLNRKVSERACTAWECLHWSTSSFSLVCSLWLKSGCNTWKISFRIGKYNLNIFFYFHVTSFVLTIKKWKLKNNDMNKKNVLVFFLTSWSVWNWTIKYYEI